MRVSAIVMSLLLAACTAPTPQPDATRSDAAHLAPGAPQTGKPVKMPPLGDPLPPERVPGYCEADSDCIVRASRNGCGACVGRDDANDVPATGNAACTMQETEGCRCVDHRCQAKPRLVDSPIEQAIPEDGTP